MTADHTGSDPESDADPYRLSGFGEGVASFTARAAIIEGACGKSFNAILTIPSQILSPKSPRYPPKVYIYILTSSSRRRIRDSLGHQYHHSQAPPEHPNAPKPVPDSPESCGNCIFDFSEPSISNHSRISFGFSCTTEAIDISRVLIVPSERLSP